MTERKTLRQLREERGWTQEQVARQLDVQQTAVSAWERGWRVPRPKYQQRLAALFGISVEDLALEPAEQAPQETPDDG